MNYSPHPALSPLTRREGFAFVWVYLIFLFAAASVFAAPQDSGMNLYKQGKFPEAAQAFEDALQKSTTRGERRVIYLYMGKSYLSAGRLDKAISAYEQALDYDPRNWRRHGDLAGLYEQAELYWKAVNLYKSALALNPKDPSLFLSLGRIWRKIGIYAYALAAVDSAALNGGPNDFVQQELSRIYEGQGRFQDAAAASLKGNDDARRVVYLAALADDKGLLDEGLKKMKTERVSPESIRTYENLVQLLQLSPQEILAGKTSSTTLQELLKKQ